MKIKNPVSKPWRNFQI